MYLAWFDADRKKPVTQKIAEARQRYVEKFGRQPQICLVNPEDVVDDTVVAVRPLKHIGRHCFWIGVDDTVEAEPAVAPPPATLPLAPGQVAAPPRRARKAAVSATVVAPVNAATPPPASIDPPVKARRSRRERTAA